MTVLGVVTGFNLVRGVRARFRIWMLHGGEKSTGRRYDMGRVCFKPGTRLKPGHSGEAGKKADRQGGVTEDTSAPSNYCSLCQIKR